LAFLGLAALVDLVALFDLFNLFALSALGVSFTDSLFTESFFLKKFNPTAKLALVLCIALDKKFEELFYFD